MLTELEVSTLHRLANGQLVKQVASADSVSHSCIDKRISNIKRKLNAKTLCEAVYKASKAGIICLLITTTSALEIELAINPDFTDVDIQRRFSRRTKRKSESDYSL